MKNNNKTTADTLLKTLKLMLVFGFVSATLFTMWTPTNILVAQENAIIPPAATANPIQETVAYQIEPEKKIGIIVGHRGYAPEGIPDPGAVCESDGLREVDLNLQIATLLRQELMEENFTVELLNEDDPKLQGYEAMAVVSIHCDTCEYLGDEYSGFQIKAAYKQTNQPELSERLAACIINRYETTTGLRYLPTVSQDMAEYHAFEKFADDTPSVILEAGFMMLDREILTENPALIAHGIAEGIRCYAYNETINLAFEE